MVPSTEQREDIAQWSITPAEARYGPVVPSPEKGQDTAQYNHHKVEAGHTVAQWSHFQSRGRI